MRERKVAWILLRGASVHSLSDGVLTLNFVREGDAKGFTGGGHDQVLARVLQQMLGISPPIRTVVGAPDGAASAAGAAPAAGRPRPGATGTCRQAGTPARRRASRGARTRDRLRTAPFGRPAVHSGAVHRGAEHSGAEHGGTRGGATRPSGTQPDDAQNGGTRGGATRPSGTQPDDAQNGGAQRGGARPGAAQPGGALSDDAQRGGDFDADALTGADLIQRELGGQVIAETGDA